LVREWFKKYNLDFKAAEDVDVVLRVQLCTDILKCRARTAVERLALL
jgi:hypothetical protein